MSNKVIYRTDKCTDRVEDQIISFKPGSDDFQHHSYKGIHDDNVVLTNAPTGSGKTRVIYYSIAYCMKKGGTIAVTTPIKALSNQQCKSIREELIPMIKEQTGIEMEVGIMTRDITLNPDADCIVMTTEILNQSLNYFKTDNKEKKHLRKTFIEKLKYVVFDEAHYFGDKDRGHVWESILIKLPLHINVVLLSATFPNVHWYAQWLSNVRQRDVSMVVKKGRIIPLSHYIYVDDQLTHIMDNNNIFSNKDYQLAFSKYKTVQKERLGKHKSYHNFNLINDSIKYLKKKNLLQAIFFVFSKRNCHKFANMVTETLVDHVEASEINNLYDFYMKDVKKESNSTQYEFTLKLLQKGVGFHHAGMIPVLKELIEILFAKGLLKVLFVTETFAVGLNMPTKTVIFTSLVKPTKNGKRLLLPHEYNQMSGRAGRRGIDTKGTVIILPIYEMKPTSAMRTVLSGKQLDIRSQFHISYNFLLQLFLSTKYTVSEFLKGSLYNIQLNECITRNIDKINKNKLSMELINTELDKDNIKDLKQYYDYERFDMNSSDSMFTIKLSNKELKKKRKLINKLNSMNNFKQQYENYKKFHDLRLENDTLEHDNEEYKDYVNNKSMMFVELLKYHGFLENKEYTNVDDICADNVTIKGIIAAQINECNSLLLTTMLVDGLFDDLTAEELVSLLSIFIPDTIPDRRIGLSDIKVPNVPEVITEVKKIISTFMDSERKVGLLTDESQWDVSYDYINATYKWVNNSSFHEAVNTFGEDEYATRDGNFIKNMFKLKSITDDLLCLCEVCNKQKLIPVLQNIEGLLIRDEVNNRSLYL